MKQWPKWATSCANLFTFMIYIYIYIHIYVCVCVLRQRLLNVELVSSHLDRMLPYSQLGASFALQWHHIERNGASNHRHLYCLLNSWSRRRSKKTLKIRVAGLCAGNSPVTVKISAQRTITRKMFPFDDVIMVRWRNLENVFILAVTHYSCELNVVSILAKHYIIMKYTQILITVRYLPI